MKKQNPLPTPKRRYRANLSRNPDTRIRTTLLRRVQQAERAEKTTHTLFTERAFELLLKTMGM